MRSQVHQLVSQAAAEHGDRPAVTFKEQTLTYGRLWEEVKGVGAALTDLGLRRGDRVAIYLHKSVETVSAIFGVSVAGGVFVPVNPVLRARQVGYILRDCGARILITSAERLASLQDVLADCPTLEVVILVGARGAVEQSVALRSYQVNAGWDLRSSPAPDPVPAGIDLDMAAILYTSGSTGGPKGVVLSHRNLIVGAESVSGYLGNTADDVILSVLPLSFDAGFSQLTTAFSVGAHLVLLNYLLPAEVVRLCGQHAVTGLTCVPPLWIQIAGQDWPDEARSSLRYFANTGGRMPKATLDRLRTVFPTARPYLMYGLTEAFRSTYLDPAQVDRRSDSIGKAIPNAEILVVRPDGTPCEPGEEGELVHRGALVAMGYWNDPQRTEERFRPVPVPGQRAGLCLPETAVWSGDLVVRDEEGFLYFVGRKDDMIKTSGYRVSPTEIEEVAYDTGLVRDAVALGVADPELGQRIVVVVSPASADGLDERELLVRLKRALPPYMVPRQVVVRSEIPRSPNGKFDRALLHGELTP